jgi:hypothetical protein
MAIAASSRHSQDRGMPYVRGGADAGNSGTPAGPAGVTATRPSSSYVSARTA